MGPPTAPLTPPLCTHFGHRVEVGRLVCATVAKKMPDGTRPARSGDAIERLRCGLATNCPIRVPTSARDPRAAAAHHPADRP